MERIDFNAFNPDSYHDFVPDPTKKKNNTFIWMAAIGIAVVIGCVYYIQYKENREE